MDQKYGHTSHNYATTVEEKRQLEADARLLGFNLEYLEKNDREFKRDMEVSRLIDDTRSGVKRLGACLLDSSLISEYSKKPYSYKIIECGEYYQIYKYNSPQIKNDRNLVRMKEYKKVDIDAMFKTEEKAKERGDPKSNKGKKIDLKNINRSKNEMQRLAKANESIFRTFITLTFAENIKDLKKAHRIFHNWCCNVRKLKSDFAYVAVPEFQERGAVHYHLLTNLDVKQNHDIIIPQKKFSEKQYSEMTEQQRRRCYDVIYWSHGFSNVKTLGDIHPVSYLSKYMTKDIDNRLFGHRRYYYSQNLVKPSVTYINLSSIQDFSKLIDVLSIGEHLFSSSYYDKFGTKIEFTEYKQKTYAMA